MEREQGDEAAPDIGSISHDLPNWDLNPGLVIPTSEVIMSTCVQPLQAACRLPCTRSEALGSFHSDSSEYIDKCFDSWKTFSPRNRDLIGL